MRWLARKRRMTTATASHGGYWFGTQVAIEAGFVAGGFTGGKVHHVRLRLQV